MPEYCSILLLKKIFHPLTHNNGHYCELGDGKFSLTAGWNSIQAIYGTDDWLGYKSENQKVTMRVMDFYHHDEGKIRENWVPIDIIHILKQIGVDVLESIKK